jgi:hypothetical protein
MEEAGIHTSDTVPVPTTMTITKAPIVFLVLARRRRRRMHYRVVVCGTSNKRRGSVLVTIRKDKECS